MLLLMLLSVSFQSTCAFESLTHQVYKFKSKVLLPMVTATSLILSIPTITSAADNTILTDSAPLKAINMQVNNDNIVMIGTAVSDDNEYKAIRDKLEATEIRFSYMIKSFLHELKKDKKSDAKTVLITAMSALKSDMRLISKTISGGDITVRANPGSEAKFDYNTGKFEYKMIPAKCEKVLDQVNEIYFYYVDVPLDKAQAECDKAVQLFKDWDIIATEQMKSIQRGN